MSPSQSDIITFGKIAFYAFVANFLILMQLGAKHVETPFIEFGQVSTVIYFLYFSLVMYGVTIVENTLVDIRTVSAYKPSVFAYKPSVFALESSVLFKRAFITLPIIIVILGAIYSLDLNVIDCTGPESWDSLFDINGFPGSDNSSSVDNPFGSHLIPFQGKDVLLV